MNNLQQQDLTIDTCTKEQIIELLKDKTKEFQKLEKKQDVLEKKYVQTVKDQKLILKDRETLEKIVSFFLNEEPFLFIQKQQFGQYEFKDLYDICQKREDEKSKTLTQLMTMTSQEKYQLEEKMRQITEKHISESDDKTQSLIQQFKAQVQDLEYNNTNLAKEIIELNEIIQLKNKEIKYLKSVEDDFANYKTTMMMQEMEQQSQKVSRQSDINNQYTKSDYLNEQLMLQNRIEQLISQNQSLKKQIEKLTNELEIYKSKSRETEEKKISAKIVSNNSFSISEPNSANSAVIKLLNDYDINPFEADQNLKQKQNQPKILNQKTYISTYSQTGDLETKIEINFQDDQSEKSLMNDEYLKNMIFKFFLYNETRNYKEATILRHAILTILKLSQEEKIQLEQAKNKSSVWQSAKSYIGDNLLCYRTGQQLHDNNLQGRPVYNLDNRHTTSMNSGINMK